MHTSQQGKLFAKFFLFILLIGTGVFAVYAYGLDRAIVQKFEQRKWDIPARIYSRPLILKKDAPLSQSDVKHWLSLLHYEEKDGETTGSYQKTKDGYLIHARSFDYGNGDVDKPRTLKITFSDNKIHKLLTSDNSTGKDFARLEPVEIGSIYPDSNEDRHLITLDKTPKALIDALIATEDRGFYEHYGVSIRGTTRAILNNVLGRSRQGGSTLTQQLIKNFYLTSEKSLKRKANEAVMALLLERHYSKEAILQAYINEIHLGQNGNQSINGFGIASKFYFNKDIGELELHQHALLVGLAKGSSYYNPRKHPERALERRNVVLNNMLVTGKISQDDYEAAKARPLDVVETPTIAKPQFPDFLDYARRELNARYKADDLKTTGLRILSTLDPIAQKSADKAIKTRLPKLGKKLQGALISANPQTGEVLALVGSGSEFTGFNRAIDAKRQVGSLLKPVIYLTALQSGKYNLASGVDDSEKTYKDWTPKNYNNVSHGTVPLTIALANSYNQAAVNLGMEIGLPHFINYLKQLGIDDDIPDYPSVLLGAVDLSPIQMLGMYQIFANGGVYSPLYSIDSVIDEKGNLLQKSTLNEDRRIPADAAYLTHIAMQSVITDGTAKAALSLGEYGLAGKTGTTNDARDAWFAGYSGNYVSVVWIGRDDNKPIGLTGGSGALPIWVDYMKPLKLTKTHFPFPKELEWAWVENGTGRATDETCENAVSIPVKKDTVSDEPSECQLAKEEEIRQAELLEQYGDEAVSFDEPDNDNKEVPEATETPLDETEPPADDSEPTPDDGESP